MRTQWAKPDNFNLLLTALMPQNRLAIQVSLATGLRISDVLGLTSMQIDNALRSNGRICVKELKTCKTNRVYIPKSLLFSLKKSCGKYYAFEGRTADFKHRDRSTVYKDLKRVAKIYRIDGKKIRENISVHTARKIYAVSALKQYGSVAKVQRLLNHSSEAVTMLYCMSDMMN